MNFLKKLFFSFSIIGFVFIYSFVWTMSSPFWSRKKTERFVKNIKSKKLKEIDDFISSLEKKLNSHKYNEFIESCLQKLNPKNANSIMENISNINENEMIDLSSLGIDNRQELLIRSLIKIRQRGEEFGYLKNIFIFFDRSMVLPVDDEFEELDFDPCAIKLKKEESLYEELEMKLSNNSIKERRNKDNKKNFNEKIYKDQN